MALEHFAMLVVFVSKIFSPFFYILFFRILFFLTFKLSSYIFTLDFAKITRKRALSAMQVEQQQSASRSSNINSATSPILDNNGNSFNNNLSNNNNNSSMPTPGASDVERDSQPMIEIFDD